MSNLLHWLHLFQSDAKSLYPWPGFSQLSHSNTMRPTLSLLFLFTDSVICIHTFFVLHSLSLCSMPDGLIAEISSYIHISFMFHFRDFRSIPDGLIARESRQLPQVLWEDESSFLSQGFFNCLCVLVLIKLLALFSELWKVKQFRLLSSRYCNSASSSFQYVPHDWNTDIYKQETL